MTKWELLNLQILSRCTAHWSLDGQPFLLLCQMETVKEVMFTEKTF